MKLFRRLVLLAMLLSAACQPHAPIRIAIVDGTQIRLVTTDERVPRAIMAHAGIILAPADAILCNGYAIALDATLPASGASTLQLRRAINLSVNGKDIQTTARTVGEALSGVGMQLYAAD